MGINAISINMKFSKTTHLKNNLMGHQCMPHTLFASPSSSDTVSKVYNVIRYRLFDSYAIDNITSLYIDSCILTMNKQIVVVSPARLIMVSFFT